MSVQDLRITEIMYNPVPGAPEYIEITNTGSSNVSTASFFIGNSDFLPEIPFSPPFLNVPAGGSAIVVLVPPGTSGPDAYAPFINAYGLVPQGTAFVPIFGAIGLDVNDWLSGGRSYTIGGLDVFGDSVFPPSGAPDGQSVHFDDNGVASFGPPTPGVIDIVPVIEIIEGTDAGDVLLGTSGNDSIDGLKGADEINGRGGNDIIDGGNQSDSIKGGAGDDVVYGGTGNDSIAGGGGNDELFGGSNNDRMAGGAGDDTVYGDHGKDVMSGGTGNDELYGGRSSDILNGNDGNDYLEGGRGGDILRGGAGNDTLDGGRQADTLNGGDGDDVMIGGIGNDRMTGGAGADTFVFAGSVNTDVITDFQAGVDQIDFTAYGPISDADAIGVASQSGNHVVLDLGSNGQVTLLNTDIGDLSLDDFIYIPDDIFTVG